MTIADTADVGGWEECAQITGSPCTGPRHTRTRQLTANCRNSKNLLPAVPATFIHSVDSVICRYRYLPEEKSLKYIFIIQRLVDN